MSKNKGLSIGLIIFISCMVVVFGLAAIGVVAYKGYTEAALEASIELKNSKASISIEAKKDPNKTAQLDKTATKKISKKEETDYKNLDFKEYGSRFYGVKEKGKMKRGVYVLSPGKNGDQSTWYGLFTENSGEFWKGYYHHTYKNGQELYQYIEYELDSNGKVAMDGKIYKFVDDYLITEEDFIKVKEYIQTNREIPFSFGGFDDFKNRKKKTLTAKDVLKSNNSVKNRETLSKENYYALVIGNNDYQYLDKLRAAENDATAVGKILKEKYGFKVDLLLNADYDETVNKIYSLTKNLKSQDNLLIYYAGHGELDAAENRGYWLPVDANEELRSKWISNSFIVDRIKATKAKHVLLMVDSCFSGTLLRSGNSNLRNSSIDKNYIQRLKNKKTRLVITSGGNEPVIDNEGGNHSLFAQKLLDTLSQNNDVINSQILFENIRSYVVANASQTPEIAIVHKSGHDGGDFLFFSND